LLCHEHNALFRLRLLVVEYIWLVFEDGRSPGYRWQDCISLRACEFSNRLHRGFLVPPPPPCRVRRAYTWILPLTLQLYCLRSLMQFASTNVKRRFLASRTLGLPKRRAMPWFHLLRSMLSFAPCGYRRPTRKMAAAPLTRFVLLPRTAQVYLMFMTRCEKPGICERTKDCHLAMAYSSASKALRGRLLISWGSSCLPSRLCVFCGNCAVDVSLLLALYCIVFLVEMPQFVTLINRAISHGIPDLHRRRRGNDITSAAVSARIPERSVAFTCAPVYELFCRRRPSPNFGFH
jgi:hypothetical protein